MTYEPESEWFRGHNGMCVPMFTRPDIAGFPHTYVDLGCAHPVNKSLTHFVRDLGWDGVAVDANPDYLKDWQHVGFAHHFHCAVLSPKSEERFAIHENSFTSRVSPSPEFDRPEQWGIKSVEIRQTECMNDILSERVIGKIDLLTIDLEGYEFDVLKTINFEKHSPAFIISEYVTAGEGVDPRVCNFLLGRGYEVVHMTESNLIYRRK